MSELGYLVVIEGDDNSNYSAYSPDVPGVAGTGRTREQAERQLHEAIEFHLADDGEGGGS